MKTLVARPLPNTRADEEYINHLLEECDEPLRLYEHLCWYIHTWGPSSVGRLVSSARSPKVRSIASKALHNSLDLCARA
jgi:hypothetical protein